MSKKEDPEDPEKARKDYWKNFRDKHPSPKQPPPGQPDPRDRNPKEPGNRPRGG